MSGSFSRSNCACVILPRASWSMINTMSYATAPAALPRPHCVCEGGGREAAAAATTAIDSALAKGLSAVDTAVQAETGRVAAAFPDDPVAALSASQWLDGPLLVAPVLGEDSQRSVYLPAGTWYAFNTTDVSTGPTTLTGAAPLSEVPVFAPPGAVVPLAPVVQYTDALPGGALEVQVESRRRGK